MLPSFRSLPRLAPLLPLVSFFLPLLFLPLSNDEAVYALVARGLLDGELPYREVFDHKPPPVYVYYALSFLPFGLVDYAPRVLAAGFVCGTAYFVQQLARALLPAQRVPWVVSLFALVVGAPLVGLGANTEAFAMLPATAAAYLLIAPRKDEGAQMALLAGVLSGVAVATRPTIVLGAAGLMIWLAWVDLRRRRFRRPLAFALGHALAPLLAAAPFLAAGAFSEFYYATVVYQRLYFAEYNGVRLLRLVPWLGQAVTSIGPVAVGAYIGLSASLERRRWNTELVGLLAWLAGMGAAIAAPGRFYPHHVVQVLPALVVLCGFLPDARHWRSLRSRPLLVLASVTLAALLVNVRVYAATLDPDARVQEMEQLGHTLEALTCPDDAIWEFGRETTPYFYAGRSAPTRFIYDRPFWLDGDTLDEALADLKASPPAYIVDTLLIEDPAFYRLPAFRIGTHYYPVGLDLLLTQQYEFAGRGDHFVLYRRTDYERGAC